MDPNQMDHDGNGDMDHDEYQMDDSEDYHDEYQVDADQEIIQMEEDPDGDGNGKE